MTLLETIVGELSWICEGEVTVDSPCTQRAAIDAINLLFLGIFYLFLLVSAVKKLEVSGSNRKEWIPVVVSICCAIISTAHIGMGLWDLIGEDYKLKHLEWLVYLIRGLIWLSFAVSLLVTKYKCIIIFSRVWWVSSCFLVTALNIQILARARTIQVLDMLSWPVNFLLLFCAFKNCCRVGSPQIADNGLSEPLLPEKQKHNQSKLGQAGFISKLTFSWINPLLAKGYSKPLNLEDVPSLIRDDEADIAYQKFADAWDTLSTDKSSNKTGNWVIKAVAKVYLKENILIGFLAMLRTIAVVALPLLLYAFVSYSNSADQNLYQGLFIVGILILVKTVESLTQRHWFFYARQSGMRMRSALMVAIYKKQLKLSSLGRKRHSTGEIVNYIAVDAYRLGEFPWWFHLTWTLIVQLFLSIGVLFGVVGLGAIIGLVPLFICGILNVPFARILQIYQTELMIAQDERLRATSEILNSMKIIKLQSWEEKFKGLIYSCREKEFQWLTKMQFKKVFGTILYWLSPLVVSSVTFLGCALLNSAPLDAGTIFTVLATLRSMGEPVRLIPEALSIMIQVKVSLDRINAFLLDDELKTENLDRIEPQNPDGSVLIQKGNFSWDPELTIATLRNVNLDIKCGKKIAVCGPVGAGKSSLLYAVLGEVPKVSGAVNVFGSIAYVSQISWIQSGTVRDNILYGKPLEKGRYEMAIKACALDKDINNFPHGDLTEIGQRGLNMSGGQKQRIQLARAVYSDSDIYLLDDPFSAVDAHTAAILFNDCVMTALERKTVILVTHQVEFLSTVDKILVMEGGQITQSGKYKELLMAGTAFEMLVNAHKDAILVLNPSNNNDQGELPKVDLVQPEESNMSFPAKNNGKEEASIKGTHGIQLTEEEEKEIGDVGWKPFLDYLNAPKGTLFACLGVLSQCGFVIFQAAATYWLAFANQIPEINSALLIGVYTLISIISAVFVFFRALYTAYLGLAASKAFFSGFTDSIFKAPMLFFDSTPVGRILTRASSDLSILDFDIPFSFIFVVAPLVELIAIIGIMVSVTWQVLIVATLSMVASYYVQRYYLASARELIRINGTTKAPVMNYAAETSLGVVTIRAFRMADRFFQNYLKLVDTDATLFFHSNGSVEWLVIRIETLMNITLFTGAILLILLPKGYVQAGLIGLSLSYALTLTGTQVFMIRWYCNLSNYIVSIERIKQFMHISEEPPAIVEDNRPSSSWPPNGRIQLQELKIRYRPNAPLVLKGISCTFKEGSRVGVVGRTGSGKTTLISALFRLVDPASGKILIDGLDICSIGLKDLRMKLSIIPQEPTLFKGSVRTNIDPLGLYSDHEIWEALEKCQLKATISSLPNLLDSSVMKAKIGVLGSANSFCLGRVLLKRNKILVLDEATASIDSATDAILQRIIRQEFSECTVITVAHRVPTVIDSDMVMVLSYGTLVEYDEPSNLVETNSYFSKLVAEYWASCRKNSFSKS